MDKTVTVVPDTYFCAVEDVYTFEGAETLAIAAGMIIHAALETVDKQLVQPGRVRSFRFQERQEHWQFQLR